MRRSGLRAWMVGSVWLVVSLVWASRGDAQSLSTGWPAEIRSRVFDEAQILEPGHAAGLHRVLTELQVRRDMDWRVVTFRPDPSVDSLVLRQLADTLRVMWHIGDATDGRGGLLLITQQDLETGRRRRFHASVTPALERWWTPWWTGAAGQMVQEQVRIGETVTAFQAVVNEVATFPKPLSTAARLLAVFIVLGPLSAALYLVVRWRRLRPRPRQSPIFET